MVNGQMTLKGWAKPDLNILCHRRATKLIYRKREHALEREADCLELRGTVYLGSAVFFIYLEESASCCLP